MSRELTDREILERSYASRKELPPDIKNFIESEAKKWARDHSAAPDKETPDWIITDFTAGATSLYQHLSEQKDKERDEVYKSGWRDGYDEAKIGYREEIKKLELEISQANQHIRLLMQENNL